MITPEEALGLIARHTAPLGPEIVPLHEAVDRVLHEDLLARDDMPPFDNSAMDGYAVRARDLAGAGSPKALPVQQTVRAGTAALESLKPGWAMRVMTGAPLPIGADSVVMREWTDETDSARVIFKQTPELGDHIRPRGEDIRRGAPLLKAGVTLRPHEIALLAAQGITRIKVMAKPRTVVLATGDELVDADSPLSQGRIRNSNGPAVTAALKRWGIACSDHGVAADDESSLETAFRSGLAESDVLLVTGGVSVGDFDYTRSVLRRCGVREIFWRVAVKPGKPLLFGIIESPSSPKWIFGLPGNPVSVLVCLEEFVRAALERLQGHEPRHPGYHLRGRAENAYPKPEDRRQYLFCQAHQDNHGFSLRIIRPQGSALLGMACQANALAIGPLGVGKIEEGDLLDFRWLK